MAVTRNPNGTWTADFSISLDGARKRKQETFDTRGGAEDWITDERRKLKGEALKQSEIEKRGIDEHRSLREIVDYYYSSKYFTRTQPSSQDLYRPIIERFIDWAKSRGVETAKQLFPPGERRFALYEQYYEKLKTSISPATANTHIVIIGRMFRVDMLRAVPAILVNPHVHLDKVAKGEIRWFSMEELDMIRKVANDRQLFTIDYLVSGGLRSGELINLKPFQIKTNVISIVPHDEWIPKWGKSRHIPKNERAKECEEFFRSKYTNGNYVWGTSRSKGIVPANHDGVSYIHDSLVSKVEEKFHYQGLRDTSPHTYRATCGSLMLQNKIPVEFVMKFLGHRNLQTTLKHYASLCVGNLQEAANVLDYIFK